MSWIKSGQRRLEKSAFDERTQRAAAVLESFGVGPGDGVALCLRNELAFFEASFGTGMLGAYSVPINWHYTAAEANYILQDSGAKLLIIHGDLFPALREAIPDGLKTIIVDTPQEIREAYNLGDDNNAQGFPRWNELIAHTPPVPRAPAVAPSSIIYTSGTTGKPKGVKRQPHSPQQAQALAKMLGTSYGYTAYMEGDRDPAEIVTAVIGPLYHAAPNFHSSFSIRIGANVLVEPRFDPELLLALIESERITHLNMVPIMFIRLLRLPEAIRQRYDLSSLRHVAHAAAPCPPPVKRAMIEWWGPIINEYYGTTEMGNVTCLTSEEWLAHPGSVGRAMPDAEVKILDDKGEPVAAGIVGEVVARRRDGSDFTYHNDPDKRASAEKGGLLAPGDMGYLDEDGYLYLCDRKSDMIVSGGANIYPAEIEAELHKLDGVADCAVFGIPDDEFGEAVMAVVQPMPDVTLDVQALRKALRQNLAGYKVPRRIEVAAELPREDSGKIFKRKLRAPFWEGRETKI